MPRSETTRATIIEAAEKLIAADGIEGVSLRRIRMAVGSGNTTVVAYHFGSKDGLIKAIVLDRHRRLERYRTELLQHADASGPSTDIHVLLRAMWWPYFELRNAEGYHTYAAFLASVSKSYGHWLDQLLEHEIGRAHV